MSSARAAEPTGRPAEAMRAQALARLAGDVVDEVVVTPVGDVHAAVARRVFAAVGPAAGPARAVHDTIARGAYGLVRHGARAAGALGAGVLAARRPAVAHASPRGELVVSAVNALMGDRLEAEGHPLAIAMAVRQDGRDVTLHREGLARAHPSATGSVVVFVPGLGETEDAWRVGSAAARDGSYGDRLAADLGWTPVDVRYNSGRHVSDTGRELAELLEALVAAWPVEVQRLALVGHSMGGLVARSAAHQAFEDGMAWPHRVRNLVTLGSPHGGAPLEKAVHVVAAALGVAPESRPLGAVLRLRSAGIRDLRHGHLSEADWLAADPEALLGGPGATVPALPGADHLLVVATVDPDAGHPLSRVAGDLLVRHASAAGHGRVHVRADCVRHVGGVTHLALLCHPRVYDLLRDALAVGPGEADARR